MFEVIDNKKQEALIKVVGVGGCGNNAVDYMIERNIHGVDFWMNGLTLILSSSLPKIRCTYYIVIVLRHSKTSPSFSARPVTSCSPAVFMLFGS